MGKRDRKKSNQPQDEKAEIDFLGIKYKGPLQFLAGLVVGAAVMLLGILLKQPPVLDDILIKPAVSATIAAAQPIVTPMPACTPCPTAIPSPEPMRSLDVDVFDTVARQPVIIQGAYYTVNSGGNYRIKVKSAKDKKYKWECILCKGCRLSESGASEAFLTPPDEVGDVCALRLCEVEYGVCLACSDPLKFVVK